MASAMVVTDRLWVIVQVKLAVPVKPALSRAVRTTG
jgi:hypothetical protein